MGERTRLPESEARLVRIRARQIVTRITGATDDTANAAIEMYAEAFEDAKALDKLEAFASFHGPDFYGLPRNSDKITLQREDWVLPESLPLGSDTVKPLRAGETLRWKVV